MAHQNGSSNGNSSGTNDAYSGWDVRPAAFGAEIDDDEGIGAEFSAVLFEGVRYLREVDGAYRDEWGRTLVRAGPTQWVVQSQSKPFPPFIDLSRWRTPLAGHSWFLDEWVPMCQCTALSGTKGSRKSSWILQLMLASASGKEKWFCGRSIKVGGRVLGLFCEDEEDEIGRRAQRVMTRFGIGVDDLADRFRARSLVGCRHTELVYFTPSGRMVTTPAFDQLEGEIAGFLPDFVALDIMPDFFGGNEVNRHHAHMFIRMLDGLGQKYGCAILFSHHPSLEGIRSKSMRSGSTGWEGKVRSFLTLVDPALVDGNRGDDGPSGPSDERTLTRVSSNYAKPGETIDLVFTAGGFILREQDKSKPPKQSGQMRTLEVDAKFLELLDDAPNTVGYVSRSSNSKGHYAPEEFNRLCPSISTEEFAASMERLRTAKPAKIRLDPAFKWGGKSVPSALVRALPFSVIDGDKAP